MTRFRMSWFEVAALSGCLSMFWGLVWLSFVTLPAPAWECVTTPGPDLICERVYR